MTSAQTKKPAIETGITGTRLQIVFASGEELLLDASTLTPEIREAAMMHGLKQKLIDAAAIARNTETGKSATPQDKHAAVKTVFDRLTGVSGAPTWNSVATGGGKATGGLLLRALMVVYPEKGETRLRAWLDTKSESEKAKLRTDSRIAKAIADIKAAETKTSADADALLGELEGME